MKAVIQDLQNGSVRVGEVPPPALQPDGILVRVRRSLISLGTERSVIALAGKGPLGKAMDRPDLFRKVWNKARQEGYWNTYKIVKNLIASPIPLGYSCAGEVLAIGREAAGFKVGDRVACAGLNYANHAEIDYVPRNLTATIPNGLSFESACFVTVGAIAMQGVRLAELALGERVVVIGLGLVGQIAAQLARCAGATVLATDLDPAKVEMAARLGAHRTVVSSQGAAQSIAEFTNGHGADAVLICAATKSDEPLRLAAEVSRLKGRVVVVGDVGMNVERRALFEKELSLVVSRSYGPGRYDPAYEVHGADYPLPYVRWTEQRNMQSFLELAARGDVRVEPLITHRFPIEEAEAAYRVVTGENAEPAIAILLQYDSGVPQPSIIHLGRVSRPASDGAIRVGVIGAGQFAKGVLLPAIAKQKSARFHAFCTATGFTSRHVAERYGAAYCTSEPSEILNDPQIDAVVIATRHDRHAALVVEAIRAGKAVFVEKPLALTPESLSELGAVVRSAEAPRLMVGFNRRFSPLAVRSKKFFEDCRSPKFVSIRVSAGPVPPDSWVNDVDQSGGRILGEVCHFVDTICFLTGALPHTIFAEEIAGHQALLRDSVSVTLRLSDDSVGVIHYLATGDASVSKEYLEMFGGQRTAILENYRTLSLHDSNRRRRYRLLNQAKGHAEEIAAFFRAVETGGPMPVDFETLAAVTQATFLIHRSLDLGAPVPFELP